MDIKWKFMNLVIVYLKPYFHFLRHYCKFVFERDLILV